MGVELQDERWMRHTLALARETATFASPNPTVGCVLVRGETALGEGAHRYDARDHAEIVAMKDAVRRGLEVCGATAYVTLEPCSHHGRTGPCADALLAAGVARCVVATVDPNPAVRGGGVARLRAGGVQVQVLDAGSYLATEARRLNDAFAFAIQFGRPFVTLKAALSVDGMLAPPPGARSKKKPHWLTGDAARADVQGLRHGSDAILTGIGTVLADDPGLTDRTGRARRRPLLRVVLDSALRLPLDSQMVTTAANDLLVLCSEEAGAERESALTARGIDVVRIVTTDGRLDLRAAMKALHARGLRSVLVEAGSALNGSLLAAELVDKVVLYYAASELGVDAVPFAAGAGSPYALQARLSSVERVSFPHGPEEDVRVSGYLRDPWAGLA